MKKLISLFLLAAMVLCLAACNDAAPTQPTVHNDVLDTLMAVRYRGETNKLSQLAPQAYWDWYEGQGRSLADLVQYSSGAYHSWINVMGSQFGDNLTVTYTVTAEDTMDTETLSAIANALEKQYAIAAATVKNGKVLTVSMTIAGSLSSDTSESEFLLVEIDGKDYLVMITEVADGISVTFRM